MPFLIYSEEEDCYQPEIADCKRESIRVEPPFFDQRMLRLGRLKSVSLAKQGLAGTYE